MNADQQAIPLRGCEVAYVNKVAGAYAARFRSSARVHSVHPDDRGVSGA